MQPLPWRPKPRVCAADRAPAARRVDKVLRKQDPAARAKRTVPRQTPREQRQRPRAEVRLPAGESREPRIVGDKVKVAEPAAALPADPAVARRAEQRGGRNTSPAGVPHSARHSVWSRLSARVTQEMMLPHHRAKAGLVRLRHHVRRHLGKIRHASGPLYLAAIHAWLTIEPRSERVRLEQLCQCGKRENSRKQICLT